MKICGKTNLGKNWLCVLIVLVFCGGLVASPLVGQAKTGTPTPKLDDALCRLLIEGTPLIGGAQATPSLQAVDIDLPFDVLYLDLMIRQNWRMELIAKYATETASHPELVRFAATLAEDASSTRQQLQTWRDDWYGDIPMLDDRAIANGLDRIARDQDLRQGVPGAFEMLGIEQLVAGLCYPTDPIDPALLDTMISMVSAELLLTKSTLDLSVHEEIQDLAQQLLRDDQTRLDVLVDWRATWYPTDVSAPTPNR